MGNEHLSYYSKNDLSVEANIIYQKLPPLSEIITNLTSNQLPLGLSTMIREISLYGLEMESESGAQRARGFIDSIKNPMSDEHRDPNTLKREYLDFQSHTTAHEAWLADLFRLIDLDRTGTKVKEIEERHPNYDVNPEANVMAMGERIINWVGDITNPLNWRGNPPFYAWIKDGNFSNLPRVSRYRKDEKRADWATGFGGRLVVPSLSSLSSNQRDEMWSSLLIDDHIYETESLSAKNRRQLIMQAMADQIEPNTTEIIDACGGKGDFAVWLNSFRPELKITIADNATKAVGYARQQGLNAVKIDLEEAFPTHISKVPAVCILFGIQYLSDRALKTIYNQLENHGKLILNVYPPGQIEASHYREDLLSAGFPTVKQLNIERSTDTILVAQK